MKRSVFIKAVSLLMVVFFAFALFAGCSSEKGSGSDEKKAEQKQDSTKDNTKSDSGSKEGDSKTEDDGSVLKEATKFILWTFPYFPKQEDADNFFKEKTEEFKAVEPLAEIDIQTIPWANSHEKILAAYAAGNGPDILYVFPEWLFEFANLGAIRPVDDLMNEEDKNDFIAIEDMSFNGKIYGTPCLYGTNQYIYNIDMLKEIGWDTSKLPSTLDEMDQMLALAKEKLTEGKYGIYYPGFLYEVMNGILEIMWSADVQIIEEDGTVDINTPEGIDILDKVSSWYKNGYTPKDSATSNDFNAPINAFINKDVITTFLGSSLISTEDIQNLDFEWKIGPNLKYKEDSEAYSFVSPGGWVLSKENTNDVVAYKFIQSITSKEALEKYNSLCGFLPPRKSAANIFENKKGFDQILANIKSSKGRAGYKHTAGAMSQDIIRQERQGVMLGEQTAEEAANKIAEEIERIKAEQAGN